MKGHLKKVRPTTKPNEYVWRIVLSLGKGPNGRWRQRWHTFKGTKREAESKRTALIAELESGDSIEPSKVTVSAYLDDWMAKAIKPSRTVYTYVSYRSTIEKHIKPHLGHIALQRLTPLDVQRYYQERKVHLSEGSVVIHKAILTSALNTAVESGLLKQNPASRVAKAMKPKVHVKDTDLLDNVWTAEEAGQFLDHLTGASTQWSAIFNLLLEAGLRKGELLGLMWKDLEGSTLRVDRQLLGVKQGALVTAVPKGKRSRVLDLSQGLVELLMRHKREQAELKMANRLHYSDLGLMFAQDYEHGAKHLGHPLHRSLIGTQLDRLVRDAKVKRITVHGLRHTSATLLLKAGVQPHVVQKRLGHAKVEMTLNVYSHVLPSMQSEAAERLAKLLHG